MSRPPQDEHTPRRDEERREFSEEAESLIRITLAPVIWAGHFLLCYCTLAVVCAKGGDVALWRGVLVAATVVALIAIAWTGWRSFRQWDVRNTGDFTNREGHAEDRHQFLGHAAFLLSLISGIGVIYVGLPLLLLEGCS